MPFFIIYFFVTNRNEIKNDFYQLHIYSFLGVSGEIRGSDLFKTLDQINRLYRYDISPPQNKVLYHHCVVIPYCRVGEGRVMDGAGCFITIFWFFIRIFDFLFMSGCW